MIISRAKKKKAVPWAWTRHNRIISIDSCRGIWACGSLCEMSFSSLLGRSPPGGLNYLCKVEIPTVSYCNKAQPNIVHSPPLYTVKYLIKKSHETNCYTHSKERGEKKKSNCQNRAEPTLLVSTFFICFTLGHLQKRLFCLLFIFFSIFLKHVFSRKKRYLISIKNMCLNHLESLIFFENGFCSRGLLQVSVAKFSPDRMSSVARVTLCGPLSIMQILLGPPPLEKIFNPLVSPAIERQKLTKTWCSSLILRIWSSGSLFHVIVEAIKKLLEEGQGALSCIVLSISGYKHNQSLYQVYTPGGSNNDAKCRPSTWPWEVNGTWTKVYNCPGHWKPVPHWVTWEVSQAEWKGGDELPAASLVLRLYRVPTFAKAEPV